MSSHHINPDYFPSAPPHKGPGIGGISFFSSQNLRGHIRGLFPVPALDQSGVFPGRLALRRLFPRDDVSCFDSSGSSEVTGAASRDLSEPEPRQAIIPTSPLSCRRMLPSPRCELLSVGRRDDGKMFFPTCMILSSCCGSEIEKTPTFPGFFSSTFTSPPLL